MNRPGVAGINQAGFMAGSDRFPLSDEPSRWKRSRCERMASQRNADFRVGASRRLENQRYEAAAVQRFTTRILASGYSFPFLNQRLLPPAAA